MKTKRWHRAAALTAIVFLGATVPGCRNTEPAPTVLPMASPAPTPAAHEWSAQPVLIQMITGGDPLPPPFSQWTRVPTLVLYADGRLIYSPGAGLWEAQLSPEEVCALLYQIEAYGFFDFDPALYARHRVQFYDATTTELAVRAWRTNGIAAYALSERMELPVAGPDAPVDPALADTYRLLAGYRPAVAQPYQPQRLAVRVGTPTPDHIVPQLPPAAWPLESPRLADLAARTTPASFEDLVLEGEEARAVYGLFGGDFGRAGPFSEGETSYEVWVRPLLPFERPFPASAARAWHRDLPDPEFLDPPLVLRCFPAP